MVYSSYVQQRILSLHQEGYRAPTICRLLHEEKLTVSKSGAYYVIRKYAETGTIARRAGSGRRSKVTAEVKHMVEAQMILDDESTATQLCALLQSSGHSLSLRTVLRCRVQLGWTFRGSAYCQLIRDVNKVKRVLWCQENLNGDFENVIWTDECSVQLESHRRTCCRKNGQRPKPKPRYAGNRLACIMQI